jgi:hypothetical protein
LLEKLQPHSEENVRKNVPLSFVGGLIANETPLSRILRDQISQSLPHVNIISPISPPVYGAVVMALQ